MASINGISIKKLNSFKGHEGETLYQGDLYLGNKKIGSWSQDAWSGPDQIHLDNKYNLEMLNEQIAKLNPDKSLHGAGGGQFYRIEYDLELLAADYINLHHDEENFRNALDKGYSSIVVVSDGYHESVINLPVPYTNKSDKELLNELSDMINNIKSTFYKENEFTKHIVKIYRSANDFNIGEPIDSKDITVKKNLNNMIDSAKDTAAKKQGESKTAPTKKQEIERN